MHVAFEMEMVDVRHGEGSSACKRDLLPRFNFAVFQSSFSDFIYVSNVSIAHF